MSIITWYQKQIAASSIGDRLSDSVTRGMGSWNLLFSQTIILLILMALNVVAFVQHWDPYPFILLNLIFSTQAACAAPIIMMRKTGKHKETAYKLIMITGQTLKQRWK